MSNTLCVTMASTRCSRENCKHYQLESEQSSLVVRALPRDQSEARRQAKDMNQGQELRVIVRSKSKISDSDTQENREQSRDQS